MITAARVRNFKCFSDLDVKELSRITLVSGVNAIGKSSFLEALFMFFDRLDPQAPLRHFAWRGMTALALRAEDLFSPIFHNHDINGKIAIDLHIDGHLESLSVECNKAVLVPGANTKGMQQKQAEIKIERLDSSHLRPNNFGLKLSYSPPKGAHQQTHIAVGSSGTIEFGPAQLKPDRRPAVYLSARVDPIEEDVFALGALDGEKQAARAVKFLKMFDDRLESLSVAFLGKMPIIHADIGLTRKIPMPLVSDGFTRLLTIFLAATRAANGLLLIDEIGAGVHHTLLPLLWKAIYEAAEEFNCQVVLTTHSYECMKAAAEGLADVPKPEFSFVRLQKRLKSPNEIEAVTYPFEQFRVAVSGDIEIR